MPVDGYLVGGRAGVRAAVRFQPVWRRRQAANLPEHLQMRAQLRTGTFRGRFECRHRFYQKCPYSRSQVMFYKCYHLNLLLLIRRFISVVKRGILFRNELATNCVSLSHWRTFYTWSLHYYIRKTDFFLWLITDCTDLIKDILEF